MGESYGRWTLGHDEEVMPNITSANIACGFHGGDPHVMRKIGGAGRPARRRGGRAPRAARPAGLRPPAHGRVPRGDQGDPPLPGRRAVGLRQGQRHHAAARQAARHPVPHVRGEPAPRPGRRRGRRRARSRADPHDHGHDEVRRGGAQDQGAGRRRGLRGSRLRGRRPARLAQARQGRPRLRSRQGGRAGGPHGHGGQGQDHHRARRST